MTRKKVVDIRSDNTGVSVTCSDGTAYDGAMIIGADGVHSLVRRTMRRLALAEDPKREWDPENPFVAEYNTAWILIPSILQHNTFNVTQGHNRSTLYASARNKSFAFMCAKLAQPTTERVRYTRKDLEEYVAQFADLPLTEKLTVGDVVDLRMAGMANLEEGIAKNWSLGRIVLVGDACHKVAPNAGQGFQAGLQDVVALANPLRRAVRSAPGKYPNVETLEGVFDEYKSTRMEPLKRVVELSEQSIRLQTWASWIHWVLARYIMTWDFIMRRTLQKAAPRIAGALVLEYVPASEPVTGLVEWVHPMPKASDEDLSA